MYHVTIKKWNKNEKNWTFAWIVFYIVFQGDAIVAQAAVFFTAGFETTSSLMSFALYELSWQPEMQHRLRQEIKEALVKSDGALTYDNVHSLEYMHMIACETIRMYPPLPFLDRQCQIPANEKGYCLEPYSDFVIPHNMPILIPVFAMHRDSKVVYMLKNNIIL